MEYYLLSIQAETINKTLKVFAISNLYGICCLKP